MVRQLPRKNQAMLMFQRIYASTGFRSSHDALTGEKIDFVDRCGNLTGGVCGGRCVSVLMPFARRREVALVLAGEDAGSCPRGL